MKDISQKHPDRIKWNTKYQRQETVFLLHPIYQEIKELVLPNAPCLELACGLSGLPLTWLEQGHSVWIAEVADIALQKQREEAHQKGFDDALTCCHTDLSDATSWKKTIPKATFALVVCTRYWEPLAFQEACERVIFGGFLAWETFTEKERIYRPSFRKEWCLQESEPMSLLPPDFQVVSLQDRDDGHTATRRLIAQRLAQSPTNK